MNETPGLPATWRKAEVAGKLVAGFLIPVVILVAGHWLAKQQEEAADARRNSDRVAGLLSHLAGEDPRERILAIQALGYHRRTHEISGDVAAAMVTVAATDNVEVAAAAVAALGLSMQPEIERHRLVLELLGPMMIHLDRTRSAFLNWKGDNTRLVTPIIRDGNAGVRNLLLEKAELIPDDLVDHAVKLLEHYDEWFKEYERVLAVQDTPYVFVGPKGFPFPTESAERFRRRYEELVRGRDQAPTPHSP